MLDDEVLAPAREAGRACVTYKCKDLLEEVVERAWNMMTSNLPQRIEMLPKGWMNECEGRGTRRKKDWLHVDTTEKRLDMKNGTPKKKNKSEPKPKHGLSPAIQKRNKWVKLPSGIYGWRKVDISDKEILNGSAQTSKNLTTKQRANPKPEIYKLLMMDKQLTKDKSDCDERKGE